MRNSEREAYARYLTERLDSGQSQNIVIPTTANLIIQQVEKSGTARVLDVGCFSGAMLNRIRSEVPENIRGVIELVGIDVDEEAMVMGRNKYRGISLVSGELNSGFGDLKTFDIAIMSNVIHEAIPEDSKTDQDIENAALSVIRNVTELLDPDSSLVILDGLRPENDQQLITVSFANDQSRHLFELFADRYQAFPVLTTKLYDNKHQTRVKDLAAFLTKARYLEEDYWPVESKQIYQFFTAKQFLNILQTCGMEVERLDPQVFDQRHLEDIFAHIEPEIETPAKNVLIVARKIT